MLRVVVSCYLSESHHTMMKASLRHDENATRYKQLIFDHAVTYARFLAKSIKCILLFVTLKISIDLI